MIKFLDLHQLNKPFEKQFQEKFQKFLDNGWYILGNEVKVFEESFAKFSNQKYCIGVGNGLDALVLIFKAYIELGVLQKGDEIIVPANTYIASILAILQADLVPVFVEPRLETFNINPDLIEEKISKKTRGILVVHLYGQLAEMETINEIAIKYKLVVVEDCAQAHGLAKSSNSQLPTSNFSQAYSFYPGKNLGALGDAGAITTNNDQLAKLLFAMRNYGSEKKYHNEVIGTNTRLDELQAAFLNVKLSSLENENSARQSIAKRYLSEIKNDKISLPQLSLRGTKQAGHIFHLFVIRTQNRNDLKEYLLKNDIETLIHYPIAPHKQNALKMYNHLSFPITEKIHDEVLSLPISSVLTNDEVSFIIKILNEY
jgi:dTDP-4-amino-4,6-dideoxygalactose transaminase